MDKYRYEGPVVVFGTCVANNWKAETVAPSMEKARNNLAYQFKKQCKRIATAKVELPGKITIVE